MENFKETVFGGHHRAAAHMNLEPLSQQAQDQCELEPDKIPVWRGAAVVRSHPKLRNYQQLIASGKRKVSFL